ncbi:hypothetical protein Ancab_026513 [Ancistrocladus abbreviatus]
MLRALSTRRSYHGYDRIGESSSDAPEMQLRRVTSVPAGVFDFVSSKEVAKPELVGFPSAKSQAKTAKKIGKIHPLFGIFLGKSRKKVTARPEFSRYVEYVKEGGLWNKDTSSPVMFYK